MKSTMNFEVLKKKKIHSNEIFIDALHKMHGHKQEKNTKEAVYYMIQSSDLGNSYVSYILGLLYENGDFVEANFKKSIHLITKSSQ